MSVSLRAAQPADLEAVVELLAACKLAAPGIDRQFGSGFVIASVDRARVVGVAGVERYQCDGLFRSAAVHPDFRGRGLGERLTRDRIAWARANGLERLWLLTETAADYWLRFGFERVARDSAPPGVARSAEWSGGCPASAVAMALTLEPDRPT